MGQLINMVDKTLHRQLKTEQHVQHKIRWVYWM